MEIEEQNERKEGSLRMKRKDKEIGKKEEKKGKDNAKLCENKKENMDSHGYRDRHKKTKSKRRKRKKKCVGIK